MKWDLSRGHAYRLIDSAKVIDAVSPMGGIHPTSERQSRLLARLDPDQSAKHGRRPRLLIAPRVTAAEIVQPGGS